MAPNLATLAQDWTKLWPELESEAFDRAQRGEPYIEAFEPDPFGPIQFLKSHIRPVSIIALGRMFQIYRPYKFYAVTNFYFFGWSCVI